MTSLGDNKVILIVVVNIRNQLKNGVLYAEVLEHFNRTRKQNDFWATPVNRKWDLSILGRQVCPMFWANSLYKSKETWLHKSNSVKASLPVDVRHAETSLLMLIVALETSHLKPFPRRLIFIPFRSLSDNQIHISINFHWSALSWRLARILHTVLPVVLNLQWYICVPTIFNSGTVSELYRDLFWISSFNTLTCKTIDYFKRSLNIFKRVLIQFFGDYTDIHVFQSP